MYLNMFKTIYILEKLSKFSKIKKKYIFQKDILKTIYHLYRELVIKFTMIVKHSSVTYLLNNILNYYYYQNDNRCDQIVLSGDISV